MIADEGILSMYAHVVSIVMTAAIIACPMWCGNGLCHDGECCAEREPAAQSCPVHKTAHCCCAEGPSDSNDDCPPSVPCESSCQGVCGGAVFEKPCELTGGFDPSALLPFTNETAVACQTAECRTHDGDQFLHSGGNYGRLLRTLHMSFLC